MKYYKIIKECKRIIKCGFDGEYIKKELYTEKEAKKYINLKNNSKLVEINKNKTFFSFGCRFEMEED